MYGEKCGKEHVGNLGAEAFKITTHRKAPHATLHSSTHLQQRGGGGRLPPRQVPRQHHVQQPQQRRRGPVLGQRLQVGVVMNGMVTYMGDMGVCGATKW